MFTSEGALGSLLINAEAEASDETICPSADSSQYSERLFPTNELPCCCRYVSTTDRTFWDRTIAQTRKRNEEILSKIHRSSKRV